MKKQATLLFIFFSVVLSAQSVSKEYSKDIALYRAKFFLIENVLGSSEQYKKLYIDPLAASKSTEITSIYYESENKKGLLLGFFDDFWDSSGSGDSLLISENKACTVVSPFKVILRLSESLSLPSNPTNLYPSSGVAVIVTSVPSS